MHTPQTLHSIQFTIIPKMATLSPFPYTPSPFKTPNSKPILSPLHHSSFLPLRSRKLKTTSFTFKSFSSLKEENNNKGDAGRKTDEDDPFDFYLRKLSFKASLKASIKWDKMLNDCMLKELEEFEKFLRDPPFKASIKWDKMLNDIMLKEFEEFEKFLWDPSFAFLNNYVRRMLVREKERLQKAEETFTDLDLNKLKSCFGIDTFFATDVRRFGDGGIFVGNIRRPIDEVIPKLEKKLSDAAGREVVLWFLEEQEEAYDINRQVCVVQPKAELDLQLESTNLSNPFGYLSSIALAVTTFGTVGSMSVSFLNATFGDYLASVVPLFGGFLIILGVSEIATRVTAARYGVKLSPSFLVPSIWTGCFGVVNNYESLLPNKNALFDISVARTASAYLTSLALAVAGFVAHGSFNGGDNALYIRPEFFDNNPLLSFIQLVIGPYTDDLGIVLPYAVKGVGVPVDPLAFAGLLGMVVTSLNLLPWWKLEGGRIAQAIFRRRSTAMLLSFGSILLLGIGGLRGSVLCLTWGLFAITFRGGEEIPAKDEITPLGGSRYTWGIILGLICILTLFPNIGGTFSNSFLSAFFRG